VDALEDTRDAGLIDAFQTKLSRGDEEQMPQEYAERLIGGENPVRVGGGCAVLPCSRSQMPAGSPIRRAP
jgi:hypothetical protein